MIIDVNFQWQPKLQECLGQEIQVSQQSFALVNLGPGEDSAAIIEHIEQREEQITVWKPAMRRSIQLPQLADLTALPTSNRSRRPVIGFGMSQVIFHGPTPDLSASELVVAEAIDLAGCKAIGSGRLAAQALG